MYDAIPVLLMAAPAQVLPEPKLTVAPSGIVSFASTLKFPCAPVATVKVSVTTAKVIVVCTTGELIDTVAVPQSTFGSGRLTPPLQAL